MPQFSRNIRQRTESACGPAALRTVLSDYGLPVSSSQAIERLAGTTQRGTALLELERAAIALRFATKTVAVSYEALKRVPLPAIAPLRFAGRPHYVVIEKYCGDQVLIADPAGTTRLWSREELCRRWTGSESCGWLLLLVPDLGASHGTAGLTHRQGLMRLLVTHWGPVSLCWMLSILNAVINVVGFCTLRILFSAVAQCCHPQLDAAALGMGLLALVQLPLRHFQAAATRRFARSLSKLLRSQILWQMWVRQEAGSPRPRSALQKCKQVQAVTETTAALLRHSSDGLSTLVLLLALWLLAWQVGCAVSIALLIVFTVVSVTNRHRSVNKPTSELTSPFVPVALRLISVGLLWLGLRLALTPQDLLPQLLLGFIVMEQVREPLTRLLDVGQVLERGHGALRELLMYEASPADAKRTGNACDFVARRPLNRRVPDKT